MGFWNKMFGGEQPHASQETAPTPALQEPIGDTAAENIFFGEHRAAQEREAEERALQEARDAEALATAQNAIEAVDQEPIANDEEGNMAA